MLCPDKTVQIQERKPKLRSTERNEADSTMRHDRSGYKDDGVFSQRQKRTTAAGGRIGDFLAKHIQPRSKQHQNKREESRHSYGNAFFDAMCMI